MNTLPATITAVTTSEYMSILTVSVGNEPFHLLLAEASDEAIGTNVTLAFKETEVILSKTSSPTTANSGRALVQKIEKGVVLSQITLTYHETTLIALVPTLTFNTLMIVEGDEVSWMVQPSEISLLRGTHGI
ncbi:TOBE domain-containing protein [Sulfuricurvum sp.]|uniref:TOBE domain-containing protein n=1 Tax=Sulfuricurvum sp. TaxID=2025608 RepID=UPI003C314B4B